MELTKEEQELFKLFLKTQLQSQMAQAKPKPPHIKLLQFSSVFLSLILFIAIGSLGILALSKPNSVQAANTYSETWTATNAVYTKNTGGASDAGGTIQYAQGIPANGTTAGWGGLIFNNGVGMTVPGGVTVTAWTVTGTIN